MGAVELTAGAVELTVGAVVLAAGVVELAGEGVVNVGAEVPKGFRTNTPKEKKKSVRAKVSNEGYESDARRIKLWNQSIAVGVIDEARASAEVEISKLPVASTDDEPYAIVPCVSDTGSWP